jgi:hypothetical protein
MSMYIYKYIHICEDKKGTGRKEGRKCSLVSDELSFSYTRNPFVILFTEFIRTVMLFFNELVVTVLRFCF